MGSALGWEMLFCSQYLLKFPAEPTLKGPRKQREDRRFEMGGNKYEVAEGMCFSFVMLRTQPDLCSVSLQMASSIQMELLSCCCFASLDLSKDTSSFVSLSPQYW